MKVGTDAGCFPSGRHYPGIAHLLRVASVQLASEFPADHELMSLPLLAIDTETTGRDPTSDRVVEVAIIHFDQGLVSGRFRWLVHPDRSIPQEASRVHGWTDEAVQGCPFFAAVAEEIVAALMGRIPVAYNAEFDRAFLRQEFARVSGVWEPLPPGLREHVDWIDPLTWARELQQHEKSRALGEVCARLGITIGHAHHATDDAEATLHVLAAFARDPRVPRQYGAFIQEQRRLARVQKEEQARWRSGRG